MKFIKEILLLSHEVQKHSCFLNSFSEKSLGAATSSLSPDFVNGLKHYRGVIFVQLCPAGFMMANQTYFYENELFVITNN